MHLCKRGNSMKVKRKLTENGLSLNGHWRKGIFSFLLSPVFLSIIILLFEVGLLLLIWSAIGNSLSGYIVGFRTVSVIILCLFIINSSMESSAKLTWVVFVAIFPFVAGLFYIFARTSPAKSDTTYCLNVQYEGNKALHPQNHEVLDELLDKDKGSALIANYIYGTHCYPIYKNTDVEYFPLGEKKWERMLIDLKKAKKFIFLEYFIIEEGLMWGKILEILEEKAKEGLDVRVMYDGTCAMSVLPNNYFKRLRAIGIKSKIWNPIQPPFSSKLNYRDHRKILVIDNEVAYNGGVNLADEYINHIERFGHWKDVALRLEGEAVSRFTTMFLSQWHADEEAASDFSPFLEHKISKPNEGFLAPYATNPLNKEKIAEMVYFSIITGASSYVHIITPYLILDDELIAALTTTARKGVDVQIIIPGIPDKKAVWALAKTYYPQLLEAGVKVYEYTPGFTHAKVFVADDKRAVVGTINLDYRSLYHHFECGTFLADTPVVNDIEKDFQETAAKSHLITEEDVKKNPKLRKLRGHIMKLVAPLL